MKNNKTLIQFILAGVITLSTFSACQKEYFDINENPNFPADAGVTELLPSTEAAIAHVVGNNFQIFGGLWAQYWTQSPASSQYKTIDQYTPGSNDFDRPWKALYADALKDLKTINDKVASQPQLVNYSAIAKILEAYTYQLLTDNFGDIPYSQALQAEKGILSPKYDSQRDVYTGIISTLKAGLALIDDDAEAIVPGDNDLFHLAQTTSTGSDMTLWREFGNTLLLKVYLRLAYVDPTTAAAGIAEMETNGDEFLYAGEDVKIDYLSSGGNSNPLYSEMSGLTNVQNLVASATAVDYMNDNNDYRVEAFYAAANTAGARIGIAQGHYTLPAGTVVSSPGIATGGNVNSVPLRAASSIAPVKLMTASESMFLQAEAIARGWLTSGSAQTFYEEAITESFLSYSSYTNPALTATDASDYYTQPQIAYPNSSTLDSNLAAIITQKWVSMCGNQNNEAWIEWRRTGYPDFFTESVNTKIGVGSGRFPQRFLYPSSELTRNGNFPGQKLIYEKVWWDVN